MLLSYETEFQKLDGEKNVWLFRVCLLSCQFNVSEWSDSIRLHHISGETCDNGKHAYALFPSHSSFNLQIRGDFRRICLQNLKGKQNKRRAKSVVNQQECSFRQINARCFWSSRKLTSEFFSQLKLQLLLYRKCWHFQQCSDRNS